MFRRFWSAKLLRLFLTADECHNNQPIFKNSWLTSMILQRFSYSKRVVSQGKTEIRETKKGEAMPLPVEVMRMEIYWPTTFNCTFFVGFNVMRLMDSRLLSSAIAA